MDSGESSHRVSAEGSRSRADLLDQMEKVGRGFGAVAVASYAIGLLVTNIYLGEIGVSDFASLRPRYVLTGLVAIFVPAMVLGALLTARLASGAVTSEILETLGHESGRGGRPLAVIRALLFAFVALAVPVGLLFMMIAWYSNEDSPLESAVLVYVSAAFVIAMVALAAFLATSPTKRELAAPVSGGTGSPDPPRSSNVVRAGERALGVLLAGFATVIYLHVYALQMYGSLREQYGGGLASLTQIVVTDDGLQVLLDAGVVADADSRRTPLAYLLFESSDFYVFSMCGRSFTLDRDQVALVFRDSPPAEAFEEVNCP